MVVMQIKWKAQSKEGQRKDGMNMSKQGRATTKLEPNNNEHEHEQARKGNYITPCMNEYKAAIAKDIFETTEGNDEI